MIIKEELLKLGDERYRQFHSRLVPNIEKERIIGVRLPMLRKLAKSISETEDARKLLSELPHKYIEENSLHMLLIGEIKDFDEALNECERFLPYVDNWAVCDIPLPKTFRKNAERLLPYIEKWTGSEHTYTVRYGIKALMDLFLDERFEPQFAERVSCIRSEDYYVNMMIAWYFATAFAKQYDAVIPYIEEKRLPSWVHNKTIQKGVESYRIEADKKAILKSYRI